MVNTIDLSVLNSILAHRQASCRPVNTARRRERTRLPEGKGALRWSQCGSLVDCGNAQEFDRNLADRQQCAEPSIFRAGL